MLCGRVQFGTISNKIRGRMPWEFLGTIMGTLTHCTLATPGHVGWWLGLLSATTMKMTSSIDDLVWLAPFMAVPRSRVIKHVMVYVVRTIFDF